MAGTLVALAVVVALVRSGGPDHPVPDRAPALAELAELRAAVDRCNRDLAAEQERFHAHERTVDSLRAAVSGYESEERTVVAGEFDEYLEVFTAYNESVDAWHELAGALRAGWEECHDLSARHNALVDSLSGGTPANDSPGRRGQGTGSGHERCPSVPDEFQRLEDVQAGSGGLLRGIVQETSGIDGITWSSGSSIASRPMAPRYRMAARP